MPSRAGQVLHRLGERQVLDPLDEPDHVPAGAAAEAVEQVAGRRHRQRRRLLVVERADALEVAAAGVAQLDVLADHLGDGGPLAHRGDVLVANPAGHQLSLGGWPRPPAATVDGPGAPAGHASRPPPSRSAGPPGPPPPGPARPRRRPARQAVCSTGDSAGSPARAAPRPARRGPPLRHQQRLDAAAGVITYR